MNVLSFVALFVALAIPVGGVDVFHFEFEKMLEKEAGKVHHLLDILSPKNGFKPVEILKEWKSTSSNNLGTFSWKNCGKPGDVFTMRNLTLLPDPVHLPGTLSVGFSVVTLKLIQSPLSVNLLVEKKVGSEYVKVPCLGQFGSCQYPDFCQILSLIQQCPPEFLQAGIPCKCPLQEGNYVLPNITFPLEIIPLLTGDYHIKFDMSYLGAHIGCVEIYASVVSAFPGK